MFELRNYVTNVIIHVADFPDDETSGGLAPGKERGLGQRREQNLIAPTPGRLEQRAQNRPQVGHGGVAGADRLG